MHSVALATNSCTAGDSCTTHVAKIGSVHYDTIKDAISAAEDGDTIIILNDITIIPTGTGTGLVPQISINKDITLNLNKKVISSVFE